MINIFKNIIYNLTQKRVTTKPNWSPNDYNTFKKAKFVIHNKIDDLPWHSTRKWATRDFNSIKYIIIHQSAVSTSFENINKAHITPGNQNHLSSKGAPHIAYHFGINKDGSVWQMNKLTDITWHCKNYNTLSIGINVNGNFSGRGWDGTEEPTLEQRDSLVKLIDNLYSNLFKHLSVKDSLKMHCEFDKINRPADPGFIIEDIIRKYREEN